MLLAANWKMNKTAKEAGDFVTLYTQQLVASTVPTVLLVPFTAISAVAQAASNQAQASENLAFGAQNLYFESLGAFTGEVSAGMLVELGCRFALCGHSERRQIFGETDEIISKKVIRCVEAGLTPIFCLGETLQDRNSGILEVILKKQLDIGLSRLTEEQFSKIVVAYEPVWAIGTGVVATPEQAEEAHTFIRNRLTAMCGDRAHQIEILYGGSVSPENCLSLMSRKNIDGALVGGASLKVDSLLKLHAACVAADKSKSY
jgi:triosephosphate isomerase